MDAGDGPADRPHGSSPAPSGPWHEALAYAVTGRRLVLGHQSVPSVRALADQLVGQLDLDALAVEVRTRLEQGEVWPHLVPADLTAGLGPAQFAAALQLLIRQLGLDPSSRPARVGRPQPATAADRRLLDEVPPHHGG